MATQINTKTSLSEQGIKTKALIIAAQQGSQAALNELCKAYAPLINKEIRQDKFFKSLGYEDGMSIAKTALIELVLTYTGADYDSFPGYVKCRVHYALLNAMQRLGSAWEHETSLEATMDNDDETLNRDVYEEDGYEEIIANMSLRQAMRKINKHYQEIIYYIYFKKMTKAAVAKLFGCSPANIIKKHDRALRDLRMELAAG